MAHAWYSPAGLAPALAQPQIAVHQPRAASACHPGGPHSTRHLHHASLASPYPAHPNDACAVVGISPSVCVIFPTTQGMRPIRVASPGRLWSCSARPRTERTGHLRSVSAGAWVGTRGCSSRMGAAGGTLWQTCRSGRVGEVNSMHNRISCEQGCSLDHVFA
jgi:hypothetical protein